MASKFANKKYDWTPAFLDALRDGATARAAAEIAGVNFTNAYDRRRGHRDFAAEWDAAKEFAKNEKIEALEQAMYKRALEFSDNAAIALLKGWAPHVYKDRQQVEHVQSDPTQAREELKAKLTKLFDRTEEKKEAC